MAKRLRVDVWSDIACPWCYVGKRRLESALASSGQRDSVDIVWRSFELDPSAPRLRNPNQSQAEHIAQKYGTSVGQAQALVQRLVDVAAVDGLKMDFERIRPGNTFDAHRLLHLAAARGLSPQLMERFMAAYFSEGEAIGDPETLTRLAVQVGLDADEVQGVLGTDLYASAVRADQEEARSLGVSGVPFFVFGARYAVSGAQPAELLAKALATAFEELPDITEAPTEGPVCGEGGCA